MGEMLAMWWNTYSRLFETGYTAFHFLFFLSISLQEKHYAKHVSTSADYLMRVTPIYKFTITMFI